MYYTIFSIICQSDKYLKEELQMSLLYFIEILGAKNLEEINPPSVTESEWWANTLDAIIAQEVTWDLTSITLKFNSQDEYTSWIERHKLTDATLLDDFRVWNASHGFSHNYEVRTDDETVVTPLKLIPLD